MRRLNLFRLVLFLLLCLLMACNPPPSQTEETTITQVSPELLKADSVGATKILLNWNENLHNLFPLLPQIKASLDIDTEKSMAQIYSDFSNACPLREQNNCTFYLTFVSALGDSLHLIYDEYGVPRGREFWTKEQLVAHEKALSIIEVELPADYLGRLVFYTLKEDYINLFRGKRKEALKEWFFLKEGYNSHYRLSEPQRRELDSVLAVYGGMHDNVLSTLNSAKHVGDVITIIRQHNEISKKKAQAVKAITPEVIVPDEAFLKKRTAELNIVLRDSPIELLLVRRTFIADN